MSELAFAELQTKVKTLPFEQIVLLKNQVDGLYEKGNSEHRQKQSRFTDEEARLLFEKFSGSISREIDYKKEREEWRDEKYGYSN